MDLELLERYKWITALTPPMALWMENSHIVTCSFLGEPQGALWRKGRGGENRCIVYVPEIAVIRFDETVGREAGAKSFVSEKVRAHRAGCRVTPGGGDSWKVQQKYTAPFSSGG